MQPLGVLSLPCGPPEHVGGEGAEDGGKPIDVLAHEMGHVRVVARHVGDDHVGQHDVVPVQPVVEVAAIETGAVARRRRSETAATVWAATAAASSSPASSPSAAASSMARSNWATMSVSGRTRRR